MGSWDLLSVYPPNTDIEKELKASESKIFALSAAKWSVEDILYFQEIGKELKQADSYLNCLVAQNTSDAFAWKQLGFLTKLNASYSNLTFLLSQTLKNLDDAALEKLLSTPQLKEISFYLKEIRELAQKKLDYSEESLINNLSAIGYHGFFDIYSCLVGKMRIVIGDQTLSVGQVENFLSHPDRLIRCDAFKKWEKAWAQEAEVLAQILNHLAGFRLQVYEKRGWKDILYEPLFQCRMQQKTLDVMWDVIQKNKPIFLEYLKRKAKLLGLKKLSWIDVQAPLNNGKTEKISFEEAAAFIHRHFEKCSLRLSDYAKAAIDKKWIEFENRSGKQPGGFCAAFPKSKESRIYMTFDGSMNNVSTLAHEIGHGYHNERLLTLPFCNQQCGMNVAETASTFAEMVVIDGALKEAKDTEKKLFLLDDKLQRAVLFFMNIHTRFLFEKQFYEERKSHFVSSERLCELMETSQKIAYMDCLEDYYPYFWASKLHFYYTDFPFYNFPYTFGYLFSLGLYAHSKKEGKSFMEKYDRLLDDSARMQVEDLAAKYLQVDLTKPEFWQEGIDLLAKDVEEFLQLSNSCYASRLT